MAAGTPYIGSKISLISKAEIRYEGILYEVNSKDSTVTLSKVRSFGTEGRPAVKHIQPRSEVYEYIIFRGSDIKDLSVSEMAKQEEPPQDPAIVSAQAMPTRTQPPPTQAPSPPQPVGMHPNLPPPPGPGYTPFPPTGINSYNPFGMPYFGRPPMIMGQPHPQPHLPHIPQQHSATTQPISPPKQVQVSPLSSAPELSPHSLGSHDASTPVTIGNPPASSRFPSSGKDTSAVTGPPTSVPHSTLSSAPISSTIPLSSLVATTPPSNKDEEKSDSPPSNKVATTNSSYERSDKNSSNSHSHGRPSRPHPSQHQPNSRGHRGNSGGYRRGVNPSRSRGSGRELGPSPPSTAKQPLRYDSEFDFETANSKFSKEQLEVEIREKLKIEEEPLEEGEIPADEGLLPPQHRGSLNDGLLIDGSLEEGDDKDCYDRTVSFFDTITCESNQSSNKRGNRNEERALNTETFGVSGFRGRGRSWGSYNRGRGGYRSGRDYNYRGPGDNYYNGDYYSSKGRGGNYRRGGRGYRRGYEETYHDGDYGQHGGRRNYYSRSRDHQ